MNKENLKELENLDIEEEWDKEFKEYVLDNVILKDEMVGILSEILFQEYLTIIDIVSTPNKDFEGWIKSYTIERLSKSYIHIDPGHRFDMSGLSVILDLYNITDDYIALNGIFFLQNPPIQYSEYLDAELLEDILVCDSGNLFTLAVKKFKELTDNK